VSAVLERVSVRGCGRVFVWFWLPFGVGVMLSAGVKRRFGFSALVEAETNVHPPIELGLSHGIFSFAL
jgi:hypothetical protein